MLGRGLTVGYPTVLPLKERRTWHAWATTRPRRPQDPVDDPAVVLTPRTPCGRQGPLSIGRRRNARCREAGVIHSVHSCLCFPKRSREKLWAFGGATPLDGRPRLRQVGLSRQQATNEVSTPAGRPRSESADGLSLGQVL